MTIAHEAPMIHAGERIVPPAENQQLMRRLTDRALPGRPLDWDEAGTPIDGTVVYQYHPRAERFPLWADIRTREHLLDIQAQPERYEVRTLFTVSVDDLARGPLSRVSAARERLDQIEKVGGATIASMRASVTNLNAAVINLSAVIAAHLEQP